MAQLETNSPSLSTAQQAIAIFLLSYMQYRPDVQLNSHRHALFKSSTDLRIREDSAMVAYKGGQPDKPVEAIVAVAVDAVGTTLALAQDKMVAKDRTPKDSILNILVKVKLSSRSGQLGTPAGWSYTYSHVDSTHSGRELLAFMIDLRSASLCRFSHSSHHQLHKNPANR
jgi:hypothetical protein